MGNNKFKFHIPSINIEKAKGDDGEEIYTFEGKAGGMERDYDGEVIMPDGADLTDFKVVNWQHRKDPESIVGEVTEYSIDPKTKDLMIKGMLYPSSPTAKGIAGLMKVIGKDAKNLRLGLSVEGRAIERDEMDSTIVTKSKLTGVAICTVPKNPSTWAKLLEKGVNPNEDFKEEYEMDGDNYLDYTDVSGDRYIINKSFEIEIIKGENKTEFSEEERKKLAEEGKALPDGSFPIRNLQDLKDAISSFGRASNKKRVKRWIKKRAKDLGSEEEIPDSWKKADYDDENDESENSEEKAVMAGSATGAEYYNVENTGGSLKKESVDEDLKTIVAKGLTDLIIKIEETSNSIEKSKVDLQRYMSAYEDIKSMLKVDN